MPKIVIPEDSPQTLKDLVERAEAGERKVQEDAEHVLSTRERLMRHLNRETTKYFLSDDDNDFIELHLLSSSEQRWVRELVGQFQELLERARKLTERLAKADTDRKRNKLQKDVDKLNAEAQKLLEYQLYLLSAICVDPELNFEYWKNGSGFFGQLPSILIAHVIRFSRESVVSRISDARFFRRDQQG